MVDVVSAIRKLSARSEQAQVCPPRQFGAAQVVGIARGSNADLGRRHNLKVKLRKKGSARANAWPTSRKLELEFCPADTWWTRCFSVCWKSRCSIAGSENPASSSLTRVEAGSSP